MTRLKPDIRLLGLLLPGLPRLQVLEQLAQVEGAPKVPPRRLVEYEALLNNYLPGSWTLIICQYHRSRFEPELIREVVRAHPLEVGAVLAAEHAC